MVEAEKANDTLATNKRSQENQTAGINLHMPLSILC